MKLPRYTAKVPSGMRKSGQTRATNIESLTNTGEQAVHRADQTKWGAIGDIGKSLDYASGLAFKRHQIETEQLTTEFTTGMDKYFFDTATAMKGAQVKSESERDEFRDGAMAEINKEFQTRRKEYEKHKNNSVLSAIDNDWSKTELIYRKQIHSLLDGNKDRYQRVHTMDTIEQYVETGQYDKAVELGEFAVNNDLYSRGDIDSAILRFETKRIASDILFERGLSEAESFVMGVDMDTNDKRKIVYDLGFEASEIKSEQEQTANQYLIDIWEGKLNDPQVITDALKAGLIDEIRAKSLRKAILKPKDYTTLETLRAEDEVRAAIDRYHSGDITNLSSLEKLREDAVNTLYENAIVLGKAKGSSLLARINEERSERQIADDKATAEMKREGKSLMEEYIRTKDPISGMFTDDKQEIILTAEAKLLLDIAIDDAIKKDKPMSRRDLLIKMMEIGQQQRRKLDTLKKEKKGKIELPVPYELGTGAEKSLTDEPKDISDFEAEVKRLSRIDREKAKNYYDKWKDKW